MGRVSNRQILEAIEDIAESVTTPAYSDPYSPALTLEQGEYYGIADVLEEAAQCYALYHHNPLFRRAVDLKSSYVWGRGVTLMSPQPEVDLAIRDFLERNARELGHLGRTEQDRTLTLEGNLFYLLEADDLGAVTLRRIPMREITESRRDPEDYRTIWYWKRTYLAYEMDESGAYGSGAERTEYHPALGYEPPGPARPASIDDIPVRWDAPIHHMPLSRIGSEIFAMPAFAAARPWATSYSHFLSQIASIASSLARFAWRATAKTPTGAQKIEKILDLETGETTAPGGKRPAGAAFVATEGMLLNPIKTAGVATSADEGRRFALMVCSGTDTPEHMLMGDPSTGNLATTRMLERPFELSILDRQLLWADCLESLITHAVRMRVEAAGFTPLTGTVETDDFGRNRILVDITVEGDEPEDPDGEPIAAVRERQEAEIIVEFPSVLEHDMITEVGAIIDAATLKGMPPAGMLDRATLRRLLLSALNIPDVDDLIAGMDPADLEPASEPEPAPDEEPGPFLLSPPERPAGDEAGGTEEHLNAAVQALRSVVRAAQAGDIAEGA